MISLSEAGKALSLDLQHYLCRTSPVISNEFYDFDHELGKTGIKADLA